jgi:hypothetical protein
MRATSLLLITGIASLLNSSLAIAQDKPLVVSTGKQIEFTKHAAAESATIFAFYKPASTLEADFIDELKKNASPKIAIRLIALTTGQEPVAKQYEIIRTPTAIVIDRRGRITGRSSKADDIRLFAIKAARVMRIDWAEEGTDLFAAADKATGSKGLKPGIMRTLSLQPEWLKQFYTLTRMSHFEDSHLTRKSKEMIATYVSGLNKCKF